MFFRKRARHKGERESDKEIQVPEESKEHVLGNEKVKTPFYVEVSNDEVKRAQKPVPSADEQQKNLQIIDNQRQREEVASAKGVFVENQRVRYFFKTNETWYDAIIVGVHYDDGPDRPYYTIRYWRNSVDCNENQIDSVVRHVVEKQTTPDRLERVDFDPQLTWKALTEAASPYRHGEQPA